MGRPKKFVTVDKVDELRKNLIERLVVLLKEWSSEVYKDEAPTSLVKLYNRHLMNRDNLKVMVVNSTNCDMLFKQLTILKKELDKIEKEKGEKESDDGDKTN